VRFFGHHVLTVRTRFGRKLRPKLLHQASPLVRVKPQDLVNAGIQRVPKVVGVKDGLPLLADDRRLEVKNVIWCTGYEHGFPWIHLPVFATNGEGARSGADPIHTEGIVPNVPGLYFVGLHFLYAMSSATLIGVGRDAERIVGALTSRTNQAASATNRRRVESIRKEQLIPAVDQADIA
jgi:putative flavoprotein involved in K+ transport